MPKYASPSSVASFHARGRVLQELREASFCTRGVYFEDRDRDALLEEINALRNRILICSKNPLKEAQDG